MLRVIFRRERIQINQTEPMEWTAVLTSDPVGDECNTREASWRREGCYGESWPRVTRGSVHQCEGQQSLRRKTDLSVTL